MPAPGEIGSDGLATTTEIAHGFLLEGRRRHRRARETETRLPKSTCRSPSAYRTRRRAAPRGIVVDIVRPPVRRTSLAVDTTRCGVTYKSLRMTCSRPRVDTGRLDVTGTRHRVDRESYRSRLRERANEEGQAHIHAVVDVRSRTGHPLRIHREWLAGTEP
jgi:hypothetical protein